MHVTATLHLMSLMPAQGDRVVLFLASLLILLLPVDTFHSYCKCCNHCRGNDRIFLCCFVNFSCEQQEIKLSVVWYLAISFLGVYY